MDRAHESVGDTEFVVQHFCHRRETIGGAAGVGNDRVLRRIVDAVVDPDAKCRIRILRRRADQHPFCSSLGDVQFCFVACGEKTGRFQDNIDIQLLPREIPRVAFLEDLNFVTAHNDVLFVESDFAVEPAMDRVPFEEMSESFSVGEIIDCADVLDLFLRHRPQDVATDASEAVDSVISHKQKGLNLEGFTP